MLSQMEVPQQRVGQQEAGSLASHCSRMERRVSPKPNYLEAVNNKTNNHRIKVNGKSMTIAQAARLNGMPHKKLWKRIVILGWPVETAVAA